MQIFDVNFLAVNVSLPLLLYSVRKVLTHYIARTCDIVYVVSYTRSPRLSRCRRAAAAGARAAGAAAGARGTLAELERQSVVVERQSVSC